jgi:hypothetical protein
MGMLYIQDYYLYAAIGVSGLLFIISLMLFMSIKNNCPDAFDHWKAKRANSPICRVHFRGKSTVDYIAQVDKVEKAMGTPYWTVPTIGLKFKPEADSIHFIEGNLPCCDYYENIPKSIKVETAVAYSQLKDYFKKIGIPIDGIEDLAFYISSESEVSNPETAIKDARINSEETKTVLRRYIKTVQANKDKLKNMRLESGVFTWQTAMNALDSTIAYTSSSLTHTKETIRAAVMRQEENKKADLIKYAIVAFILAMALGAIYIIMG